MTPWLSLQDVRLGFGGKPLFDAVTLNLSKGDKAALVGRNGVGKSTLLKIAAGLVEPDAGTRFVQPGVRFAFLPQEPDFAGVASALDYVAAGLPADEKDALHKAHAALADVGLAAELTPNTFSGGQARRAALARAFVADPDILLLDEPTNHLDLAGIAWLEAKLAQFTGAMVVISHDRTFLRRLTDRCLWIDQRMIRTLNKGFAAFDAWQEKVFEDEEKRLMKLDKKLASETSWLRTGVTARRRRNQGRLARLMDMRARRSQVIQGLKGPKLAVEEGDISGKLVIEALGVSKSYADKTVVRDFSTRILRGDRIGIIGPNGAGKTTLLRLLVKDLEPDAGTVRHGAHLTLAYFDQTRASLDPDLTLWRTLVPQGGDQVMVRGRPRHVVGYLKDFLFDDKQAKQPVGSLSGGERNRLMLARALAQASNLLVLDEPTNDLDMDTLDLLQEMLADYEGTLIVVSHDRDFLDRLVSSTIALEGDGEAVEYAGGYSDYLLQRKEPGRATVATASKSATKPRSPRKQTKLSYKDERQADELARRLPALQREIGELEAQLADGGLFQRDAAAFERIVARLDACRRDYAGAEEEWLKLELLREELEGSG